MKTKVTERIFKLTLLHSSVIFKIPWIHWISLPFRENSTNPPRLHTCVVCRHFYFWILLFGGNLNKSYRHNNGWTGSHLYFRPAVDVSSNSEINQSSISGLRFNLVREVAGFELTLESFFKWLSICIHSTSCHWSITLLDLEISWLQWTGVGIFKCQFSLFLRIICSSGSRISPKRGRQLPGGGGEPTYDFVNFFRKLHENEKKFGRRASPAPTLRSATDFVTWCREFLGTTEEDLQ